MKTSYRLMTESEIKQIRKGDTLYLDAEFNELALHTAIASKDAYAYIEDGIEQWKVEDTEGNVYGLDTLCTKREKGIIIKDNTFVIVGVSQTITMLIITAIASTSDTILAFFGIILLIDAMCYVAHHILNKKY